MERLGTGIGWRPAIAEAVEAMAGIEWVEVVAENVCPGHLPDSLRRLRERGVAVVPHGVGLGLGGAERPDPVRLAALAQRAEALGSPLVTEHIAFVRAGGERTASRGLEAGHLLPVPRTREGLAVLCENVRIAQDQLPVPLAVENIAALFSWPGEELTEGQFLYELADRTGVRLLIDVANLHTNHVNQGEDPAAALDALPLEALAYVHVAGGFERDGVWHDSHAHPVPEPVLAVLAELASRVRPPGVLLERDERFPSAAELEAEVAKIRRTVAVAGRDRVPVGAGGPARARTGAGGRGGDRPGGGRGGADAAGPRADGAAVGSGRGNAGAGGVRPGAAAGAEPDADRQAGLRGGLPRPGAGADPRRHVPAALPAVRGGPAADRRVPRGRARLRAAHLAGGTAGRAGGPARPARLVDRALGPRLPGGQTLGPVGQGGALRPAGALNPAAVLGRSERVRPTRAPVLAPADRPANHP
ncbi:hypothetical protein MTP02_07760 [Streptomyces albus]|nr:hypothetical protein MTP02_07760 [Streptomyces albus]